MRLANGVPQTRDGKMLDVAITSTFTISAGATTGTFSHPSITASSLVTFDVITDPGALVTVLAIGTPTGAVGFGTVNGVYTSTNGSIGYKVYGTSTSSCTVLASIHEPMTNASGPGNGPG